MPSAAAGRPRPASPGLALFGTYTYTEATVENGDFAGRQLRLGLRVML